MGGCKWLLKLRRYLLLELRRGLLERLGLELLRCVLVLGLRWGL